VEFDVSAIADEPTRAMAAALLKKSPEARLTLDQLKTSSLHRH
jgi:GTP cyclohydrolase FolE2